MSNLQPYRGNRDCWERREIQERRKEMGNGVQYKERIVVSETRKGNVRVKRVQQFDFKKGGGPKTIKF
jgi:hypothetical protein